MEENSEELHNEIQYLKLKLEEEIKKNKIQEENLYNITKQLHETQETYLKYDDQIEGLSLNNTSLQSSSEVKEEVRLIKLENKSLLAEMDIILKNKSKLENLCQQQSIEIERATILINNYLKTI